jgi:trehalose-phosphatase
MRDAKASRLALLNDSLAKRLHRSPLVIMLDVDGTLAPIAPTPWQAEVPAATRAIVARLARMPGITLAIVSGRSAEDAWRLAGVPGAWVIGNHGFELRTPEGTITPDERVGAYEDTIASAARLLSEEFGSLQGAIVENKRWTLSVHYRLVDSRDVPHLVARSTQRARELGLRVLDGKMLVELRPPVDVNKGTASAIFVRRAGVDDGRGAAMYAGDDRTDEDAFVALRSATPDAVTVRIAAGDEQRAQTAAEFLLESTEEMRDLLEWIAARRASVGGDPD